MVENILSSFVAQILTFIINFETYILFLKIPYISAFYWIAMSLNPDDKNNNKKEEDENKRSRRTYERNDKPPTRRPLGVSALGIASIATAVVMLSSGAYFVAYAPSIHDEWHTSPRQSSYWSAKPADLIPSLSLLLHVTEADIATFGATTIALAAVPAIVSFGLFRGRSWSWNASVIFFAVASASLLLTIGSRGAGGSIQVQGEGIAANIMVQSIVYAGLSIATLYYLTRPRIKTFFGKNVTIDDNSSSNSMQHQSPTMPSS
jgi:hypothetical protein